MCSIKQKELPRVARRYQSIIVFSNIGLNIRITPFQHENLLRGLHTFTPIFFLI